MIHRIDSPHGFLARLFLVYVRDEPGQSGDHEQAVHHRRIESQISQDRAHCPIDVDRQVFAGGGEDLLDRSGRLHVRSVDTSLSGKLEQPSGARIVVVNTMTEAGHALIRTFEIIEHGLGHAIK